VAAATTAPAAPSAATPTLTVLQAAEQAAQLAPLVPPVAPTLPPNGKGARPVPAGGWKYAFIGAIVHPYYNPFPFAFKQVEHDLPVGTISWQMPQQFDQNVQNQLIDGAVAQGYNLMGIQDADPAAGNVEIAKVVAQGIPVVSFAGCANQPSPDMYCLATDVQQSAYTATTALIKQMGGKGNIVHLSGNNADANTKLRIAGVAKAIAEHPGVTLLQTIVDDDSAETAQNAVSSLFAAKRSQINGIVTTAYNPAVAIANELTSLNEKSIPAILQDSDPIVTTAIANGYVYGTMSQNPFGQAYIGVYSLYLWTQGYTWKKTAPWYIDSGSFLITKDNLATVNNAMADLTQKMVSSWATTYFDAPK
jgi:ribose transport system substrate-binding protein